MSIHSKAFRLEQMGLPIIHRDELSGSAAIGEKGGFGAVVAVDYRGKRIAVKYLKQYTPIGFERETRLLALSAECPFIVRFVGFVPALSAGELPGIAMELLPLSLFKLLYNSKKVIASHDRYRILSEMAHGVAFLHACEPEPILHNDLKPENILLSDEWHVKLTDFGYASIAPTAKSRSEGGVISSGLQYRADRPCCTSQYIAPELWLGGARVASTMSDVYAMSMVMYDVIVRERPYSNDADSLRTEDDWKMHVAVNHERPSDGDLGEIASLVKRCWHRDAKKRPTAHQIAIELDEFVASATSSSSSYDDDDDDEQVVKEEELTSLEGNLARFTCDQLRDLCRVFDLPFKSKDLKADLVDRLKEHRDANKSLKSGQKSAAAVVAAAASKKSNKTTTTTASSSSSSSSTKKNLNSSSSKELSSIITAAQARDLVARREKQTLTSWEDVRKATRSDVAVEKLQSAGYHV